MKFVLIKRDDLSEVVVVKNVVSGSIYRSPKSVWMHLIDAVGESYRICLRDYIVQADMSMSEEGAVSSCCSSPGSHRKYKRVKPQESK